MNDSVDPDAVTDENSFLKFAKALLADRELAEATESAHASNPYGPDRGGWENTTISEFLEAAIAWAEDSDFGRRQGSSLENPWQAFAVFLYCGKIYE
jgi:hypothetical protein